MVNVRFEEVFDSETRSFPTSYDKFRVKSKTGSRVEPVYSAFYNEKGVLELEVSGKRDIYLAIQSHADSVDINRILQRFASGEFDVLGKVQGFFADVSDMPKTYQDVLNCVAQAEQLFDSLPVEQKKKFNNSFSEFLVASGKSDFLSLFESADSGVSDESGESGDDVVA